MNLFSGRTGDNYEPQCMHHDVEHVDDSFDHEFGTQQIYYKRCLCCGIEMEEDDFDYDDE